MKHLLEPQPQINIQEDEIDLKEIWNVIFRQKILIASIASVIFLLSIIYAYFSINIYSTYASIQVENSKKTMSMSSEIDIFAGSIGRGSEIADEIEILQSRELLLELMNTKPLNIRYFQQGLVKDAEVYSEKPFDFYISNVSLDLNEIVIFKIKILDKNSYYIKAKSSDNSVISWSIDKKYRFNEVIKTPYFTLKVKPTQHFNLDNDSYEVSYQSNKNSFIDSFIRSNLSVEQISKQASIVKVSFEDNIPQRGVDIVNTLVKLYFAQKIGFQKEETGLKLKFVNEQLKIIYDNLSQSQDKLKFYKEENTVASIPNSSSTILNTLIDVDTQLAQTEMKLNILEGLMNNENISYISMDALGIAGSSLTSTITALHQKTATRNALLSEYTPKHPDVVELSSEIHSLESSIRGSIASLYNSVKKQKDDLITIKQSFESSLSSMPSKEIGLLNLNRNFQVNEKMYSYLLEKKAEFEIMNASTVSKNRILDNAILYPKPIKPKRLLIAIVGLIVGLILGMLVAFVLEFIDNKIITPENIEHITNIPIYGVVPENKQEGAAFIESLNMIRTNMEFISSQNASKVIMISSNIPEEGKTTISAHLARTLARGNKKVVLVDLDMRKSKLLREFLGVNVKYGMSSLLVGKATLNDAIIHIEDNLDVIFSGKIPPNPSELLLSQNIQNIIDELKNSYDYIIIDTAPIGLVTDTMILLKKHIHDLFLVVIRSRVTDKSLLENFDKMVHKHHLNSVGLILNGVKITQANYYGYGYGYGYGLDSKDD
jgi:capsular exopolysaccharide synthesis family protein